MAKWTAAALLAGADMIKLGYVSRSGPRDNSNHVILATQVCVCVCACVCVCVFVCVCVSVCVSE